MAVYTKVSKGGIQSILSKYDVGKLIKFEEIQEGIENSNFKVTTTDGTFILTIYEKRVKEEDLPYFINLMDHLSSNGINCPKPIKDKSGEIFQSISNKKSILVTFLSGNSLKFIDKIHCYELGKNLANFHIKGLKFKGKRENDLNYRSWIPLFRKGITKNDLYKKSLLNEIEQIIKETVDDWPSDLENGHIHADLFPNNVFFTNNKLSGIIDFYFACYDILAYDIAICINSWCFNENGKFSQSNLEALLLGYSEIKKLRDNEKENLLLLTKGAAIRFFLTRLFDWYNTPSDANVKKLNPNEYLDKVLFFNKINNLDFVKWIQ